MTQADDPPHERLPPSRIARNSLVLLALAVLILLAAAYAYHLAKQFSELRNACLIALMVAGAGASVCFAGMIYFLDRPLLVMNQDGERARRPRWYVRLTLSELKRILLVLQILAMGLAVAAAGIMIFHFPIPGA